MGRIYSIFILGLLICSSLSCRDKQPAATQSMAEFSIEGMVCEVGCAKHIEKKLAAVSGIVSAEIFFTEKNARIIFDPAVIKSEDITAAVVALDPERYSCGEVKQTTLSSTGKGTTENSNTTSPAKENVAFRPIVFPDIFRNLEKLF